MKLGDINTPYSVLYVHKDGFVNTGGGAFETREDAVSEVDRRAAANNLRDDVDVVIIFDRRYSYGVSKCGKIKPPKSIPAEVAWHS